MLNTTSPAPLVRTSCRLGVLVGNAVWFQVGVRQKKKNKKKEKKNGGCSFDIDYTYNSEVRGGLNEGLKFKIGPSWDE